MSGEQLQQVLNAFDTHAESSELRRSGFDGVSTFETRFESSAHYPIEGRTNEQAILQVITRIRRLVTELDVIGV